MGILPFELSVVSGCLILSMPNELQLCGGERGKALCMCSAGLSLPFCLGFLSNMAKKMFGLMQD